MTRTKTQKARARAARAVEQPQQALALERRIRKAIAQSAVAPARRRQQPDRWHLAVQTPWGSGSMGSGDKAVGLPRSSRVMGRNSATVNSGPRVEQQEELIGTAYGSIAFKQTTYPFQPANSTAFPWLFEIARKYQKWVALSVRYEFRSSANVFSTAASQGRVVLAFDYDALDADFANLQQAETIQPHALGVPAKDCQLVLDPVMLNGAMAAGKFCRPGIVPVGGDIKSYDGGTFHFCTQGMAADGTAIGELYVVYQIKLLCPIIPGMANLSPQSAQSATALCGLDGGALTLGGVTTNLPLTQPANPTGGPNTQWNGIDLQVSGSGLVLHAGRYRISARWSVYCSASTMSQLQLMWYYNGVLVPQAQWAHIGPSSFSVLSPIAFLDVDASEGDVITLYYTCVAGGGVVSSHDPKILVELI